jgi:regulator of replication initiation timing
MMLDKQTKQAFSTWVNFMLRTKNRSLLNSQRGTALKHCMEAIVKRSSKSLLYAVQGINDKLLGKLKDLSRKAENLLRDAVSKWRKNANELYKEGLKNNIAGERLRRRLEGVSRKTMQAALRKVKDGGNRVSAFFRKLLQSYDLKLRDSFLRYRLWTLSKSHKLRALTMRLVKLSKSILRRTLSSATDSMIGDSRVRRLITRLVKNYENMQKEVIRRLWHRVEKIRTIRKINSAYFVFRSLMAYAKRVQAVRFKFWKDLEYLRRRRIMRKSTAKMMVMSSVSYESAFWKWKYVLSRTGFQLMPKHSLAFKKMILIGTNYQKRLEQFSFYKLALWYKNMTYGHKIKIPEMVNMLNKHSRDFSQEDFEKPSVPVSEAAKSVENPSQLSTVATGKLSREEVDSINRLGALEMMFNQLKGARIRNLSWGICSILTYSRQIGFYDNERSRLIDQINELRFEKHSLLEDNNTLRHHNESLIENLEKTNVEFQTLSLHLDQMRLVRMVRVVSKMIEVPMAEAFSYLYENNLDY